MKAASMNILPKALPLIVGIFLMQGCATTTINTRFESDPSGAYIFFGFKQNQMNIIGTTPHEISYSGIYPFWKEAYFQFKKDGYADSEIIHEKQSPVNTDRKVSATLKPIETVIDIKIGSIPPGAQIYAGEKPEQMKLIGTTPYSNIRRGILPYWEEYYYQLKKDGYADSEIIHEKQYSVLRNRRIYVTLEPKSQPINGRSTPTIINFQLESNPPYAVVYGGPSPNELRFVGITPETLSGGPDWYFQFKKDGFYDSEIIHAKNFPGTTFKKVVAILNPLPQAKASPPAETKPEPKISSPPETKAEPIIVSIPKPKESIKPKIIKTGTAFFVNKQGNIVSNLHVVQECNGIEVRNASFKAKAQLLFTDNVNDLALLIADTVPPLSVGYFRAGKEVRVGDDIITIGYPLTSVLGESAKVTKGNISSLTGIANDSSMLQISAPIQPGSSGGPLLDNSGNIVGIVSAKLSELAMLKATGSLPQNVNFAIKAQTIQLFLSTHKVKYLSQESTKKYETADVAEKAEEFTLQVQCLE
jgi:S1-C subfamily serine protease